MAAAGEIKSRGTKRSAESKLRPSEHTVIQMHLEFNVAATETDLSFKPTINLRAMVNIIFTFDTIIFNGSQLLKNYPIYFFTVFWNAFINATVSKSRSITKLRIRYNIFQMALPCSPLISPIWYEQLQRYSVKVLAIAASCVRSYRNIDRSFQHYEM